MENGMNNASTNVYNPFEEVPSPLAEQLSYLRFIGLGVWKACVWLCFFSTCLLNQSFGSLKPGFVLQMYLISTTTIAATMFVAGIVSRLFTRLVDS